MSIGNELDSYLKEVVSLSTKKTGEKEQVIWEEDPVTFQEFLTSPDHLGFPGYSDRQMDVVKFMFGKDPKKIFDNENYLCLLEWGKGSGKDTLAIHLTMYSVYVLLCCKNPHSLFLGIDKNSTIDIINVAYNAKQASSVFFLRLVNCVKNWKWLRNKYKYVESGKSKKLEKKYQSQEIVNIKSSEILFPKNILAVSMHSQQEAAEGKNTLIWILDEVSAFSDKNKKSNGYEMFQTLKTSSYTRFEKKGKGFVISWPRYKGDPIQTLCEQYKDDPHVYVDIASTFEVKPKKCFSDEWTTWNGFKIPVTFLEEFEKNPEDSKRKYLCIPGESSDPFFTEKEKLLSAVDKNKMPMFNTIETLSKTANGSFIIKKIQNQNYNTTNTSFVLAGDIGLSYDWSTLSMWHRVDRFLGNNQSLSYYIQDWMLYWKPDQEKKIKVDINNIQEIIFTLIDIYKVPIAGVYFDHYNSAQLIQSLVNRGINARAYTLTLQDFFDIRVKIYSGLVKFLDSPEQMKEMERLTKDNQGKPDHPYKEHDDIWRANCLAIMGLSGFKNQDSFTNDDGVFIKKKKAQPGVNPISGEQEAIGGVNARLHSDQSDDVFNALNNVNGLD